MSATPKTRTRVKRTPILRQDAIDSIGRKAAAWVRARWETLARQELGHSAPEYVGAMDVAWSRGKIVMRLRGAGRGFALPVALERGQQPFDMRPGLLGGGVRSRASKRKGAFLPRAYRRIRLDPAYARKRYATISVRSSPGTWQHPGLRARKIMEAVTAAVSDELIPMIASELTAAIGGRAK